MFARKLPGTMTVYYFSVSDLNYLNRAMEARSRCSSAHYDITIGGVPSGSIALDKSGPD